jgi:cell division septal protein FtsQ
MKKYSNIFFLIILFIFLTTYNPKKLDFFPSLKYNGLFNVKKIEIINNYLITQDEINIKVKTLYGKNIFYIKISDISKNLKKNEFLEKIKIKKIYPDTIKIFIYEEEPIAVLNKKKEKFFICKSSKLISFNNKMDFGNLPNVFGEDSEIHLIDFQKLLKDNKFSISRIKNYFYYQINRWDIQLLNNTIVKLPFENLETSIQQAIKLINREDFKKYKVIDLRISGKIITEQ